MKNFTAGRIKWNQEESVLTIDGEGKGLAIVHLPSPFLGQVAAQAKPDFAEVDGGDRIYRISYGETLDLR